MIDPTIRTALEGISGTSTSGVMMTNQEAAAAIGNIRRALKTATAISDVVHEELGADSADSARTAIAKLKSGAA